MKPQNQKLPFRVDIYEAENGFIIRTAPINPGQFPLPGDGEYVAKDITDLQRLIGDLASRFTDK